MNSSTVVTALTANWNELPDEILQQVLVYSTTDDFGTIAECCRRWHRFIETISEQMARNKYPPECIVVPRDSTAATSTKVVAATTIATTTTTTESDEDPHPSSTAATASTDDFGSFQYSSWRIMMMDDNRRNGVYVIDCFTQSHWKYNERFFPHLFYTNAIRDIIWDRLENTISVTIEGYGEPDLRPAETTTIFRIDKKDSSEKITNINGPLRRIRLRPQLVQPIPGEQSTTTPLYDKKTHKATPLQPTTIVRFPSHGGSGHSLCRLQFTMNEFVGPKPGDSSYYFQYGIFVNDYPPTMFLKSSPICWEEEIANTFCHNNSQKQRQLDRITDEDDDTRKKSKHNVGKCSFHPLPYELEPTNVTDWPTKPPEAVLNRYRTMR